MQYLKIDEVNCFVRFYGEESTILIKSNLYDLKFEDCEKEFACLIDGIAVLVGTRKYTEFILQDEIHRIKLGSPKRELWIDGEWYSLYFDENPIVINLAGQDRKVFLQKTNMKIEVGKVARRDLCL